MPPYAGAYWTPSYYDGGRFFGGYWAGSRGRFEHDHRWDRDRRFLTVAAVKATATAMAAATTATDAGTFLLRSQRQSERSEVE